MSREITFCATNKCPFCGERYFSEGEDSIKLGEKIKCENCGKKFEVTWTRNVEGVKGTPDENGAEPDIDSNSGMNRFEELQKRVEHLEIEVELLKELVKLQNKSQERIAPMCPPTPLNPYYSKEPTLEPPYKITCQGGEE